MAIIDHERPLEAGFFHKHQQWIYQALKNYTTQMLYRHSEKQRNNSLHTIDEKMEHCCENKHKEMDKITISTIHF
jgi:hypothetical protein